MGWIKWLLVFMVFIGGFLIVVVMGVVIGGLGIYMIMQLIKVSEELV